MTENTATAVTEVVLVLTAKIAARFPLAEAAAALELSESSGRTAVGKIILVP
ncbi:hypothetical protein AB0F15_22935 [Amycolatopsis sp. NPDC026612]|uniref:hypothetical protein n=1 Tax=Amycolatopsis sp. NPDC026612 TaxID=3155466 RepID=UPI0033E82D3E